MASADTLGLPAPSLSGQATWVSASPVWATHTQRSEGRHGPTQGSRTQPRRVAGPSAEMVQTSTACTDCSHFRSLKLNQSVNSVPCLHRPHVASSCHPGRSRHRTCPWCPVGGPGMALPSALFPPISAPCQLRDSQRETSGGPRHLLPRKAHPVNSPAPTQPQPVAQHAGLLGRELRPPAAQQPPAREAPAAHPAPTTC